MERQKIQNSQQNPEEEQSWRTDITNLLWNHSNEDSMVLMREQINRTEQSPERDLHLYSQVILRGAKAINEAKIVLSTNSAGIDFYTHTHDEFRYRTYTFHKN